MKRILIAVLLFVCVGVAFAQPTSQPTQDPAGVFNTLVNAFQQGKILIAIAALITLLTWLFNLIVTKLRPGLIPASVSPWIAASLGMVSAVVASLIAGQPLLYALVGGLVTGNAASGFWSMIAKYGLESKATRLAKDGGKK